MTDQLNKLNQNDKTIIVLMATYNGGKYLIEQIESIVNQTYTNWILVIRDDKSSDITNDIIAEYTSSNKNIIHLTNTSDKTGALANFIALFSWAKNNLDPAYIMFCDQDDIWLPQKIERSFACMQQKENSNAGVPLLIYSDLELIDEDGENLNQRINVLPQITFNKTIAQNYCFGCTMLLNKNLINLVDQISDRAENHDYWITLVATAFGFTFYLDAPVILYRQHNNNVTSQGNSLKKRIKRYTTELNKEVNKMRSRLIMFNDFYKTYNDKLNPDDRRMLFEYLESYKKGVMSVFIIVFKFRIWRLNFLQNIAFFFLIIKYIRTNH